MPATQSDGRLTIEKRGDATVLICGDCDLPFLSIKNGELRFQNKHGSAKHENIITLDQIRTVIFEAWKQLHPPEYW